jgi:hypothetical protein
MRPKAVVFDPKSEKAMKVKDYLLDRMSGEDDGRWKFIPVDSENGVVAVGQAYGFQASICIAKDPVRLAEGLGLNVGQVVFVTETNPDSAGAINIFTLSGERAKNLVSVSVPFATAFNFQEKQIREMTLRNFLFQLFACYFKHYEKRKALGMEPWGCPKGMRSIPEKGDTVKVLSTFAFPFSGKMHVPNGEPVTLKIILCPNYNQERTGVTAYMLPHKIAAYVRNLASIISLSEHIRGIDFFSLNGESVEDNRFRRILNPKVLGNPQLKVQLDDMFEAYETLFREGLHGITDVNFQSVHKAFAPELTKAEQYVCRRSDLLEKVVASVIATSPAATGVSREETRQRVAGDLALTMSLARSLNPGDVVLDTKFHLKSYWEPIFPAVQEVNPRFSLYLLPGYYSHNLAYE